MKNFTALAAEQIKAEYFQTCSTASASDFGRYVRTKEYEMKLQQAETKLKREHFNSKENQKIWNVYRNHRMPAVNDSYGIVKRKIEKFLTENQLGFVAHSHLGLYDVMELSRTNYLMFTTMLSENEPLFNLYYKDETFHSLKSYVQDIIYEEVYQTFLKLNKISEHNQDFLSKKLNVVNLTDLLQSELRTIRKSILEKIAHHFNGHVILELLYLNPDYEFLKLYKNYKQTVLKMIKKEIPSDYTLFYPEARSINREFILHIGPTNSGKTYDAIQEMMQAETGIYLSPLRLLALEIQEKLNANGVPCDLYTGEEQDFIPDAKHMSCTIEELSTFKHYDLAVIDEAQLIKENQRGWAWTQAILGVCADKVHVCMSEDAKDIVIKLIEMCDDKYTIVNHERNTPLKVQQKLFKFPDDVAPHDALIVFSRKSVLQIAAELEKRGIKASVIYGALPCTVRREEVRKFIEGETDVVVATDAIGMGLNLPIQRVVFLETMKFDGTTFRPLNHSEIKQIAGRAGRRGIYDVGYVASIESLGFIRSKLKKQYEQIEKAKILFPESLLELDVPLLDVLLLWQSIQDTTLFEKADIKKEIDLSKYLAKHNIELDKETHLKMIEIPFEHDDPVLLSCWGALIDLYLENKYILNCFPIPNTTSDESLEEMEKDYRILELLYSFVRLIGYTEMDLDIIVEAKEQTSGEIVNYLKKNKRKLEKRCVKCGRKMKWSNPRSICNKCFFDN